MLDKPVLSLGRSLLSGKGIAYEVDGPADTRTIDAWLASDGLSARAEKWADFAARLLGGELYATTRALEAVGLMGADTFALALRECSAGTSAAYARIAIDAFASSVLDKLSLVNYVRPVGAGAEKPTLLNRLRGLVRDAGRQR
jgi:hypothetical protein